MADHDKDIDWDYWRNADVWRLDKACRLVHRKNPDSPTWEIIRERLEHYKNPDPRSRPAWSKLYRLALAAKKAEILPCIEIEGSLYVRPRDFLPFAREKGVTIPPELDGIESSRPAGWPWGSYETKLLRDLAAAFEHWWKDYDPNDWKRAPIDIDVAGWLVKERGVAKEVAKSMAKILRVEGLPRGPRKGPK